MSDDETPAEALHRIAAPAVFRDAIAKWMSPTTSHTDLYLGDDGRGYGYWQIICDATMSIQEVKAPLPKDYACKFCGAMIRPTTSVGGVNPRALVEDTKGLVVEEITEKTAERVIRDARQARKELFGG